jgi:hypothetical protein
MQTIVAAADVTIESLQELLSSSYVTNEIDAEGRILATTDSGLKVFLTLNESNKLIKFALGFRIKEDASEEQKLNLANRINDKIILVRYAVPAPEVLVADYFLPYGQGIIPLQIVNSLKLLDKVCLAGIREHDTDSIVA